MYQYLIRRGLQGLFTVVVVSIIVFLMLFLAPGDPAVNIAGADADPKRIEIVRERYGLDLPMHIQYFRWASSVIQGDFGVSYMANRQIAPDLFRGLRVSMILGGGALAIAVLIGIPIGIIGAVRRGGTLDLTVMGGAVLGMSIPSFWLGLMFILFFSLRLGWLPSGGWGSVSQFLMPAVTLSLSTLALLARMSRSVMIEVIYEDYIRTARAKGLSERVVLYKHALRNAMLPVVTVMGLRLGFLVSGAVITENVFSIPGIGRFLVSGVNQRDFPVVQGSVLVIALIIVLINLFIDVVYSFIDPRIAWS